MIDFPNSPTLNQQFPVGTKTWQWDGVAWIQLAISDVQVQAAQTSATAAAASAAPAASAAASAVLGSPLVGFAASNAIIVAADTVLAAFGKAQGQISANITADLLKAPLASPALTGLPTAPTAAPGTNTTQLATTAYATAAIAALIDAAPGALDSLNELAAAIGDDPNFAATLATAMALKANLASPTFTGTVAGVTKAMVGLASVDDTTDLAKPVSTLQAAAIALKADAAGTTASLALKADAAATTTALDLKADTAVMTTALALKADAATTTAALVLKADTTALTAGLALKADAAAVATALALKADDAATTAALALKASASDLAAVKTRLETNLQTGTAYTLVLADAGKRVDMANAAANVVTIPLNATVAYPVDTFINVSQGGAGSTSIAATDGVTINTADGLKVDGIYRMVSLFKTATDTWLAVGTVA